jgi:hypothetical protein
MSGKIVSGLDGQHRKREAISFRAEKISLPKAAASSEWHRLQRRKYVQQHGTSDCRERKTSEARNESACKYCRT